MKNKSIGIFLGTFDPIHNGHLSIALEALSQGMDKVVFYPSYDAPHKNIQTSNEERLIMCHLAVANHKNIETSSLIIDRKLGGYDMAVLEAIMTEYPNDKLYYILGSDIYLNILSWPTVDQIAASFDFLVMLRHEEHQALCHEISHQLSNRTLMMTTCIKNISSSQIKSRLKNDMDVSDLLPKEVYHHIQEHSTYEKN